MEAIGVGAEEESSPVEQYRDHWKHMVCEEAGMFAPR